MNDNRNHLIHNRGDVPHDGRTPIVEFEGITVSILEIDRADVLNETAGTETAWLLMQGEIHGTAGEKPFALRRTSLFDEAPSCIHVAAGTSVTIEADSGCELTVYRCGNRRAFAPRVIEPGEVPNEHRGAGQVAGRCLRFVRTIFDGSTAPAEADLVLGEVVTLPGGWSSYPPHHHAQPEIYYYRFAPEHGYGPQGTERRVPMRFAPRGFPGGRRSGWHAGIGPTSLSAG